MRRSVWTFWVTAVATTVSSGALAVLTGGCGGTTPRPAGATAEDAAADVEAAGDAPTGTATDAQPLKDGSTGGDARGDEAGLDAGAGEASTDGDAACPLLNVQGRAGAARSTGYSGMLGPYFALFDVPCSVAADCVPSCVDAGGSSESCAAGSQCLQDLCPDGGQGCPGCLPPTYWLDVTGALGVPGSGTTGQPADDDQAFDNGYNDTLELTDFGLSVPSGAVVQGIVFQVDHTADDDQASDQSVRALQAGVAVGTDHAQSQTWPTTYTEAAYGSSTDLWGATWTPAQINASGFGIAITPQYLTSVGNDHVDIDSVQAVVYYNVNCP